MGLLGGLQELKCEVLSMVPGTQHVDVRVTVLSGRVMSCMAGLAK